MGHCCIRVGGWLGESTTTALDRFRNWIRVAHRLTDGQCGVLVIRLYVDTVTVCHLILVSLMTRHLATLHYYQLRRVRSKA